MNSLEERIVDELQAERDLVPPANPGPTPSAQTRLPGYLGVAAALMAILGMGILALRPGPAPSGLLRLESLTLTVTLDGTEVTVGEHPVYYGRIEDRDLKFVPPGNEQPLVQSHPLVLNEAEWQNLDPDGPSVYVGELTDGSAFVVEPRSASVFPVDEVPFQEIEPAREPSFLRRLFGGLFESDHHPLCLAVLGDRSTTSRLECFPGADSSIVNVSSTPDGIWHEVWWLGLPPGTAVVAASIGEQMIWQRPSGSVSVIRIDAAVDGDLTLTALDANGKTLALRSPEQ